MLADQQSGFPSFFDPVHAEELLSHEHLTMSHFCSLLDTGFRKAYFLIMTLHSSFCERWLYSSAPLMFFLSLNLSQSVFNQITTSTIYILHLSVHLLLKAVAWVIFIISSFLRFLLLDSPIQNPTMLFLLPLCCLFSCVLDFCTSNSLCCAMLFTLSLSQCLSFSRP